MKPAEQFKGTMIPLVERPDVVVHMSRFQQQPKETTVIQLNNID